MVNNGILRWREKLRECIPNKLALTEWLKEVLLKRNEIVTEGGLKNQKGKNTGMGKNRGKHKLSFSWISCIVFDSVIKNYNTIWCRAQYN